MSWCLIECLLGLFGFAFIVLFLLWLMFDAIGKRMELFRHGDRTPILQWPTDTTDWPLGVGALTPLGMEQEYELGCILRQRYAICNQLLSSIYNASQVIIRSTSDGRAAQSAQALAAGLYPSGREGVTIPARGGVWPGQWQPVPIYMVESNRDSLLATAPCTLADGQITRINNLMTTLVLADEDQRFLDYLAKNMGLATLKLDSIAYIYETMRVQQLYNRLPTWISPETLDRAGNLTSLFYSYYYSSLMQPIIWARLRGGPLLGEIISHMQQRVDCITSGNRCTQPVYYSYSAQDTNIIALLSTLVNTSQLLAGRQPAYASAVLIELWSMNNTQFYVQVLHRPGPGVFQLMPITDRVFGCQQSNTVKPVIDTYKTAYRQQQQLFTKYIRPTTKS